MKREKRADDDGAFSVTCTVVYRIVDHLPRARRQYAPRALETIAFDLKLSDWEGMGLPIAYHLAMWFAHPDRGDGWVEVEDEWWDPRTSAAVKGGANEIGRLGGPWYQGSMDSLKILRLWAACAWADQKMHPGEAEAIERFIAVSDFTDAELVEARRFLAAPPAVNMDEVRELSPEAREGVYRAARGIVKLDRVVTDDEVAFLARLRDALDLDERIIARIEAE